MSIEDLNRDSAKPLTVVSLFGPETDIEEGARVLAAAASQIATRSGGGLGLGEGLGEPHRSRRGAPAA